MSSYFGSLIVSSVFIPTMAIVACRQLPFPLDACLTVESFVWQYHHLAFLERYGRAMPCVKMDWPETSYLPPPPGFTTTAWYVRPRNYGHLAVGMEFLQMGLLRNGVRVIEGVNESSITVSSCVMPFAALRDMVLFVSSPGAYMLFVGRDRYVGDLSDLRPLRAGEEMSELEDDIHMSFVMQLHYVYYDQFMPQLS